MTIQQLPGGQPEAREKAKQAASWRSSGETPGHWVTRATESGCGGVGTGRSWEGLADGAPHGPACPCQSLDLAASLGPSPPPSPRLNAIPSSSLHLSPPSLPPPLPQKGLLILQHVWGSPCAQQRCKHLPVLTLGVFVGAQRHRHHRLPG